MKWWTVTNLTMGPQMERIINQSQNHPFIQNSTPNTSFSNLSVTISSLKNKILTSKNVPFTLPLVSNQAPCLTSHLNALLNNFTKTCLSLKKRRKEGLERVGETKIIRLWRNVGRTITVEVEAEWVGKMEWKMNRIYQGEEWVRMKWQRGCIIRKSKIQGNSTMNKFELSLICKASPEDALLAPSPSISLPDLMQRK